MITKDKVSVNPTQYFKFLLEANSYEDLHLKLKESNLEYIEQKSYEFLQSNFIDFNNHLYEDINHMNSINSGLYLEMSLVTFRIFIWTAKGQGFEIFKHVLRKDELEIIKNLEDAKDYIYKHLNELQEGILKTYSDDVKIAFEEFGSNIETQKLPLSSLFQCMSIENNIKDFMQN